MKAEKTIAKVDELRIWEETSGLLTFLSKVQGALIEFDQTFAFGITYIIAPPVEIDGDRENLSNIGFVVIRDNKILSGRTYCLYSLLSERLLSGYIGIYSSGKIETLRKLKAVKDFKQGRAALYDWLRELVKASCDKLQ